MFDEDGLLIDIASDPKFKVKFHYIVAEIDQDRGRLGEMLADVIPLPAFDAIIQIAKDAPELLQGSLIGKVKGCKNPYHCLMGEVLYRSGVSNPQIKKIQKSYGSGGKFPIEVDRKLLNTFG